MASNKLPLLGTDDYGVLELDIPTINDGLLRDMLRQQIQLGDEDSKLILTAPDNMRYLSPKVLIFIARIIFIARKYEFKKVVYSCDQEKSSIFGCRHINVFPNFIKNICFVFLRNISVFTCSPRIVLRSMHIFPPG